MSPDAHDTPALSPPPPHHRATRNGPEAAAAPPAAKHLKGVYIWGGVSECTH
jgi:hypothetical protein